MKPAARLSEISRLCAKRQQAERLNRRGEVARIDAKLQPLMCEQLEWERRRKRKESDYAAVADGDLEQATEAVGA